MFKPFPVLNEKHTIQLHILCLFLKLLPVRCNSSQVISAMDEFAHTLGTETTCENFAVFQLQKTYVILRHTLSYYNSERGRFSRTGAIAWCRLCRCYCYLKGQIPTRKKKPSYVLDTSKSVILKVFKKNCFALLFFSKYTDYIMLKFTGEIEKGQKTLYNRNPIWVSSSLDYRLTNLNSNFPFFLCARKFYILLDI